MKDFYGRRDEGKKDYYGEKKNASNSQIFQTMEKESFSNVSDLDTI